MSSDLLEGLNPEQREAVLCLDQPLLIVAAAGTGKTRVITHKIAHLVRERGVQPWNILGVTFTNKAANEMKGRIEGLTGIAARLFPLSTFHSLGLRLLREAGENLGFDREWQVIDSGEQESTIGRIAKEGFPYLTGDQRSDLLKKINHAKMNGAYPNNPEALRQRGFAADEISVFSRYHQWQKDNKRWDYEDLITYAVQLLDHHPDVREHYREKFEYVVVDEFQDTNPNQYELVRLLATGNPHVTVVGDDDQAIYSWRGANVRFMFDFEKDFPGTKIIKLEQNYRSTPQILDFANAVIAGNVYRRKKEMRGDQPAGSPVFLLYTRSRDDEAESIARLIQQLRERNPELFPLAILYRINSQSLPFETELLKRGIPFQIIKGLRFFDRKEIKDALALLRLARDRDDDTSFLRLIDFMPVGIGPKTLEKLTARATAEKTSLFTALARQLPDKVRSQPALSLLEYLHGGEHPKLSQELDLLLEKSGYLATLRERGEEERLLNLVELKEFIEKWEADSPSETFVDLLDRMLLESPTNRTPGKTPVYLLTIHNAKGLEFPTAVVAGANSAYMPFFLRKESTEIEEERRLFYVAATRAINLLVLSTGSDRESPFIREAGRLRSQPVYSVQDIFAGSARQDEHKKTAPSATASAVYVEHPAFGKGRLIERISDTKYLIHFPDRGPLTIDSKIVKLTFL